MRLRFKSNVALGEISAFLFKMEHYPTREKSILEKIPIKAFPAKPFPLLCLY
jgi:hypothetical protein